MRSNPPPQLIPDLWDKNFITDLINTVFSLWSNTSKLIDVSDSATVKTTDATETSLLLIPLADENTYHVKSRIIGVQSGGTNRASYELIGTFYRSGGGATQQGATTVLHSIESDAAYDVSYDTNGNDVRIRATGTATDILWQSSAEIINLSN